MRIINLFIFITLIILMSSCKSCKDDKTEEQTPTTPDNGPSVENTYGFGVLAKVNGIWDRTGFFHNWSWKLYAMDSRF